MSSLILNPSNSGSGSVTLNIFGDDTEYNINLPKTNGTLVSSVNGKTANNNGSVTIDVGVKSVNGVAPDSKGNVAVQVQSVASSAEVVAGTDNTKMMTPLRTKESVQQFSPTDYVTGLSVSGQTVTFTKKNGTTGKITTQDTKYTHPNSGVSVGTYNTVTVNAQGHVTAGSNVKYAKSVDNIFADVNGNVSLGLHAVATSGDYNDLRNKPSMPATPNAYITETWKAGSNWYRKWSDGLIEQGGAFWTDSSYPTMTFNTPFSNTDYSISGWYGPSPLSKQYPVMLVVGYERKPESFTFRVGYDRNDNYTGVFDIRSTVYWSAVGY